jgi:hypothetical protein
LCLLVATTGGIGARSGVDAGDHRGHIEGVHVNVSSIDQPPRDEREFNVGIEVHTPQWMPGVKANASYRRVWEKRVDLFLDAIVELVGISRTELEARALDGDQFTDLIGIAGGRASERGDPEYRDILAGLVAAALLDDARIDTVSYVINRIVRLEPVHMRLLVLIEKADRFDAKVQSSRKGGTRDRQTVKWEEEGPVLDGKIHIENLGVAAEVDSGVAESCLVELATQNFVVRTGGDYRPGDVQRAPQMIPIEWRLTRLGRTAANEIRSVRRLLKARADS